MSARLKVAAVAAPVHGVIHVRTGAVISLCASATEARKLRALLNHLDDCALDGLARRASPSKRRGA